MSPQFQDVLVIKRKKKSRASNLITKWLAKANAIADIKQERKETKKKK